MKIRNNIRKDGKKCRKRQNRTDMKNRNNLKKDRTEGRKGQERHETHE